MQVKCKCMLRAGTGICGENRKPIEVYGNRFTRALVALTKIIKTVGSASDVRYQIFHVDILLI